MEFRILGPLQVLTDDRQIALGAAQQREVLAILLLHRGEVVPVDRIVDELWGERPPGRATKTVQVYVSRLRKALGDGVLVTRGGGYALELDGESLDADRFSRLAHEGRKALDDGDPRGAREKLTAALDLWRGPALADLAYESFAQSEAARLEELRLVALENRAEADLALGRHAELVPELEALVREHPTRERLREALMLALYRSGRQVEALESYRDARRTLGEELGLEPGPRLQQLERSILSHDPEIEGPPATGPMMLRRRRRGGPLVALGGALLLAVVIAAVVLSTGSDGPSTIDENSVGLIDPSDGTLTSQYSLGGSPGALAAGAGSVWVANSDTGTVARIDRGTEQVTAIDTGGQPTALAYGAGSLWVAEGETQRLVQVNPRTNRVANRFRVGNAPSGVAVGSGAVWVTAPIDGRIDRIDLSENGRGRRIDLGGRPVAVAAGASGVWAVAEEAGVVARLEPRSGAILRTIRVGHRPTSIAVGEGAVWVSNRDDGTVSRIDPGTDSVTHTVRVGGSPGAIAAGDGSIWVADTAGGTVVRIDPRARRVGERIDVESSPVALLVAQGAVWASARAPQASHRGGTLRFATRPFEFCRCIDPAGYDGRNVPLLSLVYDGLVAYRRVGGAAGSALVADLARTVPKPADGGRTFVFRLRRGPRFSNGAPVRPDDFRATIERMLRLAPQIPPLYRGIVGADRCTPRRCDLSEGIRTDAAARTVTVRLREPDPEFLHKLALPLAYVVPADSPLELARERPLLGTGPYRFERFDPERGGRLLRNARFRSWSAEARPDGFPDEVTFSIRSDPAVQVAAVRGGTADVLPVAGANGADVPADQIRDLALADISSVRSAPTLSTDLLFLNTREAPFDDVRVRRALNLAVDRRRIVQLIGGPTAASPTCQIIPPGLPGYRPVCPRESGEAGMVRARRLVERAGTAGTPVTVWSFAGPPAAIARYTRRLLERLGYRARVRIVPDIGAYFAQVADSRTAAQVGVTGWVADFLSPSSFFGPLFSCRQLVPRSPANTNLSQFCDPVADELLGRAVGADGAEGARLWGALDRRVTGAAPSVPLYNRREVLLVSHRVGNVQQHMYLGSLLDQLWVR